MAGSTNSTDFPKTTGGIQETNAGDYDGFISKLTSDLKSLTQSTYSSGTNDDGFNAIIWTNNISAAQAASDNAPQNDGSDGSVVAGGGSKSGEGGKGEDSKVMKTDKDALTPPGTPVGVPDIAVYLGDLNILKLSKNQWAVDYGDVKVGDAGAKTLTFEVINEGTGKLQIGSVSHGSRKLLTGSFHIDSSNCLPPIVTLDPSASCTIPIKVIMKKAAETTGSLGIVSDDPDTPIIKY